MGWAPAVVCLARGRPRESASASELLGVISEGFRGRLTPLMPAGEVTGLGKDGFVIAKT